MVASLEALLATAAAVTTVYFLLSTLPLMVAEGHYGWATVLVVPFALVLAVLVLIVALAVAFIRWGDRRVFFVACGLTVIAAIGGAVVTSWFM